MQSSRFRQGLITVLLSALGTLVASLLMLVIKRLFFPNRYLSDRHELSETLPTPLPVPVSEPGAPLPEPVPEPIPLPAPVPELVPLTKAVYNAPRVGRPNYGRRTLAIVSAITLAALIAITFLFSVRYYSATLAQTNTASAKVAKPSPTAQPGPLRPEFERGVIYPQWSNSGYGVQDSVWQQDVATMKTQTGAQWIEIPVLFSQATGSSTTVELSPSTPSVQSFTEGIKRAHALGYKVFFVPLMQVRSSGGWSGSISFTTGSQEQAWFDSYWHTMQPYVVAATNEHVEQMAIGTELQALQQEAPDRLWNQLIARVQETFKNTLSYDMNWSSLSSPMPAWLKNPALSYIGVSEYIPLLNTAARVDPTKMPALWQQKVRTQLDALASELGKQVLITEIGYRNSADALYHTWEATSKASADPAEQAGAYDAALSNALNDAHIAGTFFWGWNDVGKFAIAGQPAAQTLLKWYRLTQATRA